MRIRNVGFWDFPGSAVVRPSTSTDMGLGSILGQGNTIPQAAQCDPKKKKKKLFIIFNVGFCASLVTQTVKNLPAMQETQVQSQVRKIPWRRAWQLTPVFLPGESHGQRSLVGCSPRGLKELDTTEQLTLSLHFISSDSISNPAFAFI